MEMMVGIVYAQDSTYLSINECIGGSSRGNFGANLQDRKEEYHKRGAYGYNAGKMKHKVPSVLLGNTGGTNG